MVGTFGRVLVRCAPRTAMDTTRPALMSGSAPATLGRPICTSPLATAVMIGAAPLYGTCSRLMPARLLKSSPAICTGPPTPDAVSYTHLRAHETPEHLVCRLL